MPVVERMPPLYIELTGVETELSIASEVSFRGSQISVAMFAFFLSYGCGLAKDRAGAT
jgi:hypothetical protein